MAKNLVVVDSRVAGYQQWLTGLDLSASDVLVLDAAGDGLQQVAAYMLSQGIVYDAIHIVSHGASGTLYLGSTVLTQSNLDRYSLTLDQIGQGLTDSGDILLYGCDVAAGAAGQQFVEAFAGFTGADVAASAGVVGSILFGGHSTLEIQHGRLEASYLELSNLSTLLAVNNAPTFAIGDGKLTTWITNWGDKGYSVALQADGKILVAGTVGINNWPSMALVRYNRDGSLDTSFGNAGVKMENIGTRDWDFGRSVAVQADGKILVAGSADTGVIGSDRDFALVRYNSDGSLDTTFSDDGKQTTNIGGSSSSNDVGHSVTAQSDGKILVAGLTGASNEIAVVRYQADGSLDTTFSNDGVQTTGITAGGVSKIGAETCSVIIQSDGKILVAGTQRNYGTGFNNFALARLNTDGSLDATFNEDGKLTTAIGSSSDSYAQSIVLQPDGKILIAGFMVTGSYSYSDFVLARYNTDGSLDTTFNRYGYANTGIAPYDLGYSVTLQKDGKILLAGASRINSFNDFSLVRYNQDGSLDTSFSSDGFLTTAIGSSDDFAYDVVVQSDGKILVSGSSKNYSDVFALARYNEDGSLDKSFDTIKTTTHVGSQSYTENSAAVILDDSYGISDIDLNVIDNYSGSSISFSRQGGANPEDCFSIGGRFSRLTENDFLIYNGTTIIGTVTKNSGGALEILFDDHANQNLVNEVLQSIKYSNTSENPLSSVQIDFVFSDGNTGSQGSGGAQSVTGSTIVNITAVNDLPSGKDKITFASENTSYYLRSDDFEFLDPEDGNSLSGVRINTLPTQGKLFYKGGVLSASGLTFTAADLANGNLTYTSSSLTGSFTFSVKDSSGAYDSTPNTVTFKFNIAPTGTVSIGGTATQGQVLVASNTIADPDGVRSITYTWKADGTTVGVGDTYTLTQSEVGKTITAVASYTDGFGTVETVTSVATNAVVNVNDAPTGTVTISGTATQGQTLTAANTLADADGMGTITYTWRANSTTVGTGDTYTLTQAEVGKALTVTASYTDGYLTPQSVLSAATGTVADVNDAPSGGVTIKGTTNTGQVLTASHNISDADGLGTITYTWKSGGVTVGTGATYTLTLADVGKAVTVTASYTDTYGTTESVNSSPTASVTPIQMVSATFTGTVAEEWVIGTSGNDKISSAGGKDILDGVAGTDSLVGGGGDDRYIIDLTAAGALQDTVTEASSSGNDTIQLRGTSTNLTATTITLGANVENLDASGTSNSLLNFTGNALANNLIGNDAANVLTGGAGADTMDGGKGSDIYVVALVTDYATGEVIADTGSGGSDELRFTTTTASTLTLVKDTLTGIENIVIGTGIAATAVTTGSTANNVDARVLTTSVSITGNAGANVLTGGTADDTLRGNSGVDTFNIVSGSDTILDLGSGGADVLKVSSGASANATVTAAWTATSATTNLGNVNISTAGFAVNLAAVTGATNNGFSISNTSSTGTTLTGSSLSDTLIGNTGNDTLVGNAGTDSISGGNGNDSLSGNQGADTIDGGAGNDIINGGVGADSLIGGTGTDTFVFATGNSGQTSSIDTISDYTKGLVGAGDLIDFGSNLTVGGSNALATSAQASINTTTGVATFAASSGTTLSDSLADIAARFTSATDAGGEFALFQINGTGNYYLYISDGTAGVTVNDVVVELVGITSISTINLTSGNLTILP